MLAGALTVRYVGEINLESLHFMGPSASKLMDRVMQASNRQLWRYHQLILYLRGITVAS